MAGGRKENHQHSYMQPVVNKRLPRTVETAMATSFPSSSSDSTRVGNRHLHVIVGHQESV